MTNPTRGKVDAWDGFVGWDSGVALESHQAESPRRRFARRFRSRPIAIAAACYLVLVVMVALLAPLIAPHDPNDQTLSRVLEGPSGTYWLGTDSLGRDTFSRLLYGARLSLVAAVQAVGLAMLIGVVPGLVAGYWGGLVDQVISRVTDIVMSFPPLLLAISIVGVFGPNLRNAMIALAVIFAPRFVRLTRSSVMGVKEETYIEASRSIGTPAAAIVRRHVVPNILSPLIVQVSLTLGLAMLAEASLSFLGLGAQPPESSWGSMVGTGYQFMTQSPLLSIIPGLTIALTVLALNLLGDGLRDSLGREDRKAD
jgi:peptide/nickel transport system permease protein